MDEFQQPQQQQRNFNFDMFQQQGGQTTPNESNELGNTSMPQMPFPSSQIPGNENHASHNNSSTTPQGMNSQDKQQQFGNNQDGSSTQNDFTMLENFNGSKPQTPGGGPANFNGFNNTPGPLQPASHSFNNTKAVASNF